MSTKETKEKTSSYEIIYKNQNGVKKKAVMHEDTYMENDKESQKVDKTIWQAFAASVDASSTLVRIDKLNSAILECDKKNKKNREFQTIALISKSFAYGREKFDKKKNTFTQYAITLTPFIDKGGKKHVRVQNGPYKFELENGKTPDAGVGFGSVVDTLTLKAGTTKDITKYIQVKLRNYDVGRFGNTVNAIFDNLVLQISTRLYMRVAALDKEREKLQEYGFNLTAIDAIKNTFIKYKNRFLNDELFKYAENKEEEKEA